MTIFFNGDIGDMQPWYDGMPGRQLKKYGNTVSDFLHWYDGLQYAPSIPENTGNFEIFMLI